MTYRKKPVEVQAIQVSEALKFASASWNELPEWLRAKYETGDILFLPYSVQIRTLEGIMTGQLSDYIIQGIKGEIYPCRSDIFNTTYDKV